MVEKLGSYINGNYKVTIYEDGTKVRFTKDDDFIPDFSENCDVKITDKCSVGCPFCYEGCTSNGKHANLLSEDVLNIIESLHPYTEIALNGNDMDHPQLLEFLVKLNEKNVIPNITVNAKQFVDNFEKIKTLKDNDMIYGIGISYNKEDRECIRLASMLKDTVFHTIVGVTSPKIYSELINNRCKVLILGYKELQRGIAFKESNKEFEIFMKWLKDNLDYLIKNAEVVSFDNLALEQLDVKSHLTDKEWETFYMGDDGSFTFYIDLVKMEYAKNSLSKERFPINGKNIDEMFKHIKSLKQ